MNLFSSWVWTVCTNKWAQVLEKTAKLVSRDSQQVYHILYERFLIPTIHLVNRWKVFIWYTLPCQTLSVCTRLWPIYFNDSNLILTFLPGNHTLDINLTITNIHQLEIHGALLPTRVVCDSHVGFTFSNISKLIIDGLAFVACAARRDMYIHSSYWNTAIWLVIADSINHLYHL